MFEISINMDISVLIFYGYIKNIRENIDGYFDKNIDQTKWFKIHENGLKNFQKNDKIRKNTHIKFSL